MDPRARYPRPGPIGGKLIREVIAHLRRHDVALPLKGSHILCATSGGPDSIALAHLLARYGRKILGRSQLKLVHVNHGWRGKHSDEDARFVKAFAARLQLKLTTLKLKPHATRSPGESHEDLARQARKRIYAKLAEKHRGAVVLTAHHADDLAETLLWRLFTGAARTHGQGIVTRHGVELRPFLSTRKATLLRYLEEEGESWREDSTNFEGRYLRSRLRAELIPALEKIFPRATDHLIQLAAATPATGKAEESPASVVQAIFDAQGTSSPRLRRAHHDALQKASHPNWSGELHLPSGWRVRKTLHPERWTLECSTSTKRVNSKQRKKQPK